MAEIDLLDALPKIERKGRGEPVTPADREIACHFGREYFDGPRNQGYGGYVYDGRWKPVARRLMDYYQLDASSSVADIGCAKGFLLGDLKDLLPGMKIAGLDISEYAYKNSLESVRPMICIGNARDLPWPDRSFDLVLAINTLHNLEIAECRKALREIQRISRKAAYVVVDAYHNEGERERLLDWILTAKTFMHVEEWKQLFREVGYSGDYYWFILES
ncbi:MAG: class I SAM-dependent methyltransferase [Deltaproteobacteria bacterium]|nr:class I SAM-dependent methyltransferase [Deltaproteobacteria bacterium]